ncbi:MAG: amino acid-binding protein [Actinomycetota bacterium]
MLFTLRVSLPDQPGALGALAGSLGRGGANIVSLEVVERSGGLAVDELTLEAPSGLQEAIKAAKADVPRLLVEDVRPADMFLNLLSPLELAAVLVDGPAEKVMSTLVDNLAGAVWADWVAIVEGPDTPRVLKRSAGSPTFEGFAAPWMPLDEPLRLSAGDWMPSAWTRHLTVTPERKPEVAVAPLSADCALMAGRDKGPRFRAAELEELSSLAQIAVHLAGTRTRPRETVDHGGSAAD